jgi:hypothetical protein
VDITKYINNLHNDMTFSTLEMLLGLIIKDYDLTSFFQLGVTKMITQFIPVCNVSYRRVI